MKRMILPALFVLAVMPLSVRAEGVNHVFPYSAACKDELSHLVKKYKRSTATKKRVSFNMDADLGELDAQVKIASDEAEQDLELRVLAANASEVSRQSALYSLKELKRFDPKAAKKIDRLCKVSAMTEPLLWSEVKQKYTMVLMGLDPNEPIGDEEASSDVAEEPTAVNAQ